MARSGLILEINGQLAEYSKDDLELLLIKRCHQYRGAFFYDTAPQHVRDSLIRSIVGLEAGGETVAQDTVVSEASATRSLKWHMRAVN